MQRRVFLKNSSVAMVGVAALSVLGAANARGDDQIVPVPVPEQPEILITTEIFANHGHEVVLNEVTVLKGLRLTATENAVLTLDIQGQSGHPHSLVLNHAQLLELIILGELVVMSTKDAGHAHQLTLKMAMKV